MKDLGKLMKVKLQQYTCVLCDCKFIYLKAISKMKLLSELSELNGEWRSQKAIPPEIK
jgi:hypothetical protein